MTIIKIAVIIHAIARLITALAELAIAIRRPQ